MRYVRTLSPVAISLMARWEKRLKGGAPEGKITSNPKSIWYHCPVCGEEGPKICNCVCEVVHAER
jgi:hypothetical protein